MERTVQEPCAIALFTKPTSKASGRERLAKLGEQERQMAAGSSVDDLAQLWQHWNEQVERSGVRRLFANPMQDALANMLRAHGDDVLPRLARIKAECERKPRLAADRTMRLEFERSPPRSKNETSL